MEGKENLTFRLFRSFCSLSPPAPPIGLIQLGLAVWAADAAPALIQDLAEGDEEPDFLTQACNSIYMEG